MSSQTLSVGVFVIALAATFFVAVYGRRHAAGAGDQLQGQRLNKWLVGLSAGAAANSGFVVAGAVGLGYSGGAQWVMLPISWLLGDAIFWSIFPQRINAAGKASHANTLTDLIVHDVSGRPRRLLQVLVGVVLLVCLTGYVAAQWIAGQKFLAGAFGLPGGLSILAFAAIIIAYTAIGGFRGSVYADALQAVVRLAGTAIAIVVVAYVAMRQGASFSANIAAAGPDFLNPFPQATAWSAAAFVAGFAASSLGFGLGQPQILSRYLAAESPDETRAAWWVYIGFVQFTWIAMTVFGMALRGVMPSLADPETGFSAFFRADTGPILTGIVSADIFATIAATSNSLLVVMAQTVTFDILPAGAARRAPLWMFTAAIGLATMAASLFLPGSVFGLAISSVALLGAGLAPAVLIRVLGWPYTPAALTTSIVTGIVVACLWKGFGLSAISNEALPGMVSALLSYYVVLKLGRSPNRTAQLASDR